MKYSTVPHGFLRDIYLEKGYRRKYVGGLSRYPGVSTTFVNPARSSDCQHVESGWIGRDIRLQPICDE